MGTTDKRPDGVDTRPADRHDLDSYQQAETSLERMRIPLLLHSDNPHERLYIAALDGTGNSMFDDKPEDWSVVAKIHSQIENSRSESIAGGYVEGTYTQTGAMRAPERLYDGRFGHTFKDRVETAYLQLCVQAKAWLEEDSQAKIGVVGVGFSRGAEEVASLQRVIDERGIRDPEGADYKMDKEYLVTSIHYAEKPLLVAPGKTLQAALLFDPVATGVEEHDRRLPSSTLSTFQLTANHEKRNLFKSDDHIPPGFSENQRNYNAGLAAAHSNMGDTYIQNGLGIMSFNLGVNFLNRLSDKDHLQMRALLPDPAMYVIHRSEQGMHGFYGTSSFTKDGLRDHVSQLAPVALCKNSQPIDCQRKEPISEILSTQVEWRTGPSRQQAPVLHEQYQDSVIPKPPAPANDPPTQPTWHPLFQQMTDAALSGDARGIQVAGRAYAQSADGRVWLDQGQSLNQSLAQQAGQEQQPTTQQSMLVNETQTQRGPVMRM